MAIARRPRLRRREEPGSGTDVLPPALVEISAKVGESPNSSSENTSVAGTVEHDGPVDRAIVTRLSPEAPVLVLSAKQDASGVSDMQYSPETPEKQVRRATPGKSELVPRLT